MTLINFGIDFGNGYVKGKSEKGNFIIPSIIAIDDSKSNEISSNFEQKYNIHTFKRKEDDNAYIFGKDIKKAVNDSDLIHTNSSNERYTLENFKRLVIFSLAELGSFEKEESIDVRLITGMPSEEVEINKLKDSFLKFLLGMHVVERDGKSIMIHVKEVKIIEQPLGTLFNHYLNEKSQIHKDFKNGNIVVIDFGSGTTIIDQYFNMKRIGGTTINSGMRKFLKGIAKELTTINQVKVNPIFVEEGIKDKTFTATFGQYSLPFKSIFDKHVKRKIDSTIADYEDEIEDNTVNSFIITGGGANVFSDHVKEYKNNFIVVESPQTATVNGYYKLALSFAKNK